MTNYPDYVRNPDFCQLVERTLEQQAREEGASRFSRLMNEVFRQGARSVRQPVEKPLAGMRALYNFNAILEDWLRHGAQGLPNFTSQQRELIHLIYFLPDERQLVEEYGPMTRRLFHRMGCGVVLGGLGLAATAVGTGLKLTRRDPKKIEPYKGRADAENKLAQLDKKETNAKQAALELPESDPDIKKMLAEINTQRLAAKKDLLKAKQVIEESGKPPYEEAAQGDQNRDVLAMACLCIGLPALLLGPIMPFMLTSRVEEENATKLSAKEVQADKLLYTLHSQLQQGARKLEHGLDPYFEKIAQVQEQRGGDAPGAAI